MLVPSDVKPKLKISSSNLAQDNEICLCNNFHCVFVVSEVYTLMVDTFIQSCDSHKYYTERQMQNKGIQDMICVCR